jgi:signal peptidase I
VVVVGTSWGGSAFKDDYTTHRWGDFDGILVHEVRYDTPLNDVATGITDDGGELVFVTGYSEVPSESLGPTGPEVETDYATLGYTIPGIPELPVIVHWEERWDYADGRDFARDIELYQYPSGPTFPGPTHIWVTGAGGVGGTDYDVATIRYVHEYEATSPLESWSDGWAAATTWQYPRTMTVVGDEPYIAGAIAHSSADRMLALKYDKTSLPLPDPPYEVDWTKAYGGGGAYTGGVNHEARKVIHTIHGTFIAGVSNVTGEGLQFTTWRYVE